MKREHPHQPLHVAQAHAEPGAGARRDLVLDVSELRAELLPRLIANTQIIANGRCPAIIAQARQEMTRQLEREIARLQDLKKVNPSVRTEEIDLLVQQQSALISTFLAHACGSTPSA